MVGKFKHIERMSYDKIHDKKAWDGQPAALNKSAVKSVNQMFSTISTNFIIVFQ